MGSQRKFQIPITKGTRLTKKHVFETHSVAIALYHLPYGAGDLRGGENSFMTNLDLALLEKKKEQNL